MRGRNCSITVRTLLASLLQRAPAKYKLTVACTRSDVYYAAEAARIARDACEGTDELQKRIDQLESELQVWKLGHQEASKQARDAQKQLDVSLSDSMPTTDSFPFPTSCCATRREHGTDLTSRSCRYRSATRSLTVSSTATGASFTATSSRKVAKAVAKLRASSASTSPTTPRTKASRVN